MGPLIDNGFRMESFYESMKEIHFKNYSRFMIQRECNVMNRKNIVEVDPNDEESFQVFRSSKILRNNSMS